MTIEVIMNLPDERESSIITIEAIFRNINVTNLAIFWEYLS